MMMAFVAGILAGLYIGIGLILSMLGSSYVFVSYWGQYDPIKGRYDDMGLLAFNYMAITMFWPAFLIIFYLFYKFDKSSYDELVMQSVVFINHNFGEFYEIGVD